LRTCGCSSNSSVALTNPWSLTTRLEPDDARDAELLQPLLDTHTVLRAAAQRPRAQRPSSMTGSLKLAG
jgi:hypothetical protein